MQKKIIIQHFVCYHIEHISKITKLLFPLQRINDSINDFELIRSPIYQSAYMGIHLKKINFDWTRIHIVTIVNCLRCHLLHIYLMCYLSLLRCLYAFSWLLRIHANIDESTVLLLTCILTHTWFLNWFCVSGCSFSFDRRLHMYILASSKNCFPLDEMVSFITSKSLKWRLF